MKPDLVVIVPLDPARRAALEAHYQIHDASAPVTRQSVIAAAGASARAVLTSGTKGLTAGEMQLLPRLEIVCALGAGTEGIDMAAARARGIVVTNAGGANAATVADHAFALLFAAVRGIARYDRAVREGRWKESGEQRPTLSGKRLGILGLGRIGGQIARSGAAFGMPVGYHSRTRRDDVPYSYFAGAEQLARWCEFLIVCCPGGPETRALVNEAVLAALGPSGFLVNVARGSVVDTAALIRALRSGGIAGAALDVVEGEPDLPADLLAEPNVTFTPHVAGRSPEAVRASIEAVLATLARHFGTSPPS